MVCISLVMSSLVHTLVMKDLAWKIFYEYYLFQLWFGMDKLQSHVI